MAQAQYYHIYLKPKPFVTMQHITPKIDEALDWFRYDDKNWIVYTTTDAKGWYDRLKHLVEPGGFVMICRFSMTDYYGLMDKALWTWISGPKREKSPR
jgi:hypothetical protein